MSDPAPQALTLRNLLAQAWADGYAAGQLDEFHGVTRPNSYAEESSAEDAR